MTTACHHIARDELIAALRDLPPLPSVVLDLITSLGHEELGTSQYAAKISRDQALAAKTLRLANSSFYGRGRQVRSVSEAITVLGLRTVLSLLGRPGIGLASNAFCPPLAKSASHRKTLRSFTPYAAATLCTVCPSRTALTACCRITCKV
ncbi:hypothetical protein AC731_008970 [Thauera humireducens]|uniref:HDOD domain-containing protein n=1 Tax=Thauera humireducens TaxID=1134435 RepID=A0A127K537_9RHOO|nr:hypothetical protein AC731_008970 [Thauera humireducens]